jgi:hypothetical protein
MAAGDQDLFPKIGTASERPTRTLWRPSLPVLNFQAMPERLSGAAPGWARAASITRADLVGLNE